MLLEGVTTVRSCAGSVFRQPSCSSDSLSRGAESLQQSGFLGTALLRKEDGAGQRRQVTRGLMVRALKEAKPPVFILNKPERKPVAEERKPLLSLEDYDFDNLVVDPNHRSGYVALVGRPNAGKSTLLNQIIGQKLSIVTNKPQTTRHRILGICSGPDFQMVLYDTPGVIPKQIRKLDEMMMRNVRTATLNADCVLVVVDACQQPEEVMSMLTDGETLVTDSRPTLLVLNKRDLLKPGEIAKKKEWFEQNGGATEVIAVSAKRGDGVDQVKEWLLGRLPYGPAYYPKDIVSEHPERFFVAEILREKIFIQYRQEIPYVCQVNVVNYMERRVHKDYIQLEIVVEKEGQKGILLGKVCRFAFQSWRVSVPL
ncbi:hypothetical protein M758_1G162900 [Ceratodon purpureus]|nr:hypothetical protein M758_1G162900 [Ceratodon purpureus]